MAKTRAEIQKAYRERQKAKNNEEYLKKERERRRKNYVPSDQLSRNERIRRNLKINLALRRHRKRKKEETMRELDRENNLEINDSLMETSGYESQSDGQARMIVNLPFVNKRRNGPKKRINRALSKKTKELSKTKKKLILLERKHKTTLRKLQRMRKKLTQKVPSTPRSKTETQMRDAGLTMEQKNKIRKQLLMGHVIAEEVKMAKDGNRKSKASILRNVIAGRIVKKYRCASLIGKSTGLCRNKIGMTNTKSVEFRRQERFREVRRFKEEVIRFLERDDNSRNLPGKADKIKTGVKESTQKRVLTDYLSNLHLKFLSENPSVKLSLASFQRIRPKYILRTCFITRDSCLCTKHQDMALILKALRHVGIDVPANPERFIESPFTEEASQKIDSEMSYERWKRIPIEEKGKKKMIMRIVKVTETKENFLKHLQEQTMEFKEHVSRMHTQYQQIRLLKEKLPVHQAIVHMDFAENYSCKSAEEVQSAYWNQTSVTLHPTVVYTKTSEVLNHQSYVLVSDDLNHNASTVLTFIPEIIKDIKAADPQVDTVHFWTDSPTSQYRNKTVFNYVANLESVAGIKARWNYFEAGHGKGPCDGLGGATKRMADEAMKSGKVVIQDAHDFYAWTQSDSCTMKNVKFRFIKKEHCENKSKELEKVNTKPIKGTMKIHAVTGLGSDYVCVRNTSCYCDTCLCGDLCHTWRKEKTIGYAKEAIEKDTVGLTNVPDSTDDNTGVGTFEVGQFVIAIYENKAYVGTITETDPDDESGYIYKISFMEKRKNLFQWPSKEDTIWSRSQDVLYTISAPEPSGKSKRMYKLSDESLQKFEIHQV